MHPPGRSGRPDEAELSLQWGTCVVGRTGLEPVTPCASCKCATSCANGPWTANLAPATHGTDSTCHQASSAAEAGSQFDSRTSSTDCSSRVMRTRRRRGRPTARSVRPWAAGQPAAAMASRIARRDRSDPLPPPSLPSSASYPLAWRFEAADRLAHRTPHDPSDTRALLAPCTPRQRACHRQSSSTRLGYCSGPSSPCRRAAPGPPTRAMQDLGSTNREPSTTSRWHDVGCRLARGWHLGRP